LYLSFLEHALSTDGVDEHSELVMSPLTRFFSYFWTFTSTFKKLCRRDASLFASPSRLVERAPHAIACKETEQAR
jgi:hypothetical protein